MTELIKIGIVFFLILALSFRKVNLGLSLSGHDHFLDIFASVLDKRPVLAYMSLSV